jgi:hypothetical protein
MVNKNITLMAVGDIIADGPNPGDLFALAKPVLQSADVVVGQLEIPYTTRVLNPARGRDPNIIGVLSSVNFSVLTFIGNHTADMGATGVEDSIAAVRKYGMEIVGAGMNITEARKSVVIERNGVRFGFLGYNCVGPKETWATPERPGCAYIYVITHYELDYAVPGGPPTIYTWGEYKTMDAMADDIKKLRPQCDVLTVSLHKGVIHSPMKLMGYEQPVSHAVIDAGADIVLGHHQHILQGIEMYQGKPIFHGLCNFGTYLPGLAPKPGQDAQSWARRRRDLFGFEPDPEYPTYPFHPEAKYTIIAKCTVQNGKVSRVSYLPCLVNKQAQPEVLKHDARGQEVFDYVEKITRGTGLNARYKWAGDEIVIHAE